MTIPSKPNHADNLPRLNRISGQIDGIKKMIEEERYCVDIVNQIKEYLSKREQIISKLQKRKDIIKNLEKQIFEIENEFNKLSEVNFGLSKQIEKNENIFKKLDKKYKDDRKEKSNMLLENNLKKIKLDLENIKNEFQIKIKKLKEINNKNIEDIQNNKNIIDVKRDLLNKLEKKKID
jgi:chromosome segregation ATPase